MCALMHIEEHQAIKDSPGSLFLTLSAFSTFRQPLRNLPCYPETRLELASDQSMISAGEISQETRSELPCFGDSPIFCLKNHWILVACSETALKVNLRLALQLTRSLIDHSLQFYTLHLHQTKNDNILEGVAIELVLIQRWRTALYNDGSPPD
jgi:hypothetical protein